MTTYPVTCVDCGRSREELEKMEREAWEEVLRLESRWYDSTWAEQAQRLAECDEAWSAWGKVVLWKHQLRWTA